MCFIFCSVSVWLWFVLSCCLCVHPDCAFELLHLCALQTLLFFLPFFHPSFILPCHPLLLFSIKSLHPLSSVVSFPPAPTPWPSISYPPIPSFVPVVSFFPPEAPAAAVSEAPPKPVGTASLSLASAPSTQMKAPPHGPDTALLQPPHQIHIQQHLKLHIHPQGKSWRGKKCRPGLCSLGHAMQKCFKTVGD